MFKTKNSPKYKVRSLLGELKNVPLTSDPVNVYLLLSSLTSIT